MTRSTRPSSGCVSERTSFKKLFSSTAAASRVWPLVTWIWLVKMSFIFFSFALLIIFIRFAYGSLICGVVALSVIRLCFSAILTYKSKSADRVFIYDPHNTLTDLFKLFYLQLLSAGLRIILFITIVCRAVSERGSTGSLPRLMELLLWPSSTAHSFFLVDVGRGCHL